MSIDTTNTVYVNYIKRTIDFLAAFIICILLLSWLLPVLALLIKLESKGPVFFLQDRTGKNNTTFKIIKFRSMLINIDKDSKQATHNDERITKLGKFLRKYSIDEIPQLLNVLKGDMSLVGPRPHMIYHTNKYTQINKNFALRTTMLPGITGMAQIMGYRGEIKNQFMLNNRIKWDLFYSKKCNLALDIFILYKTLQIFLFGDIKAKIISEVKSGKIID